jgi:hypothetical protein
MVIEIFISEVETKVLKRRIPIGAIVRRLPSSKVEPKSNRNMMWGLQREQGVGVASAK